MNESPTRYGVSAGPRWRWPAVAVLCLCANLKEAQGQQSPAEPVTPPEVDKRVDAIYTPEALEARQEATGVLLVPVGADGNVTDVAVAQSGGEALDRAAIEALRQWKFTPARRGNEAICSRLRIPLIFALPTAGGVSPPAQAQPTPPPENKPEAPGSPAPTPPEIPGGEEAIDVTVRGRPRPVSRGSSDFQHDVGALATVPRQNAAEMLKLAPRILLTNA